MSTGNKEVKEMTNAEFMNEPFDEATSEIWCFMVPVAVMSSLQNGLEDHVKRKDGMTCGG